jgi:transcriptional regulator GlxA family with amidase domain
MKQSDHPIEIYIVLYHDANVIDVTGPAGVFTSASELVKASPVINHPGYQLRLVAESLSPARTSGGIRLVPDATLEDISGKIDTLLVPGGRGSRKIKQLGTVIRWLQKTVPATKRPCSVCTGAFLLAEAGVLDGKTATTHWQYCDLLQKHYPEINVEADPIFIADGNIRTSAGVTAGMDLALAIVEEDFGHDIAIATAREMVMDYKRPGGQAQFSDKLTAQLSSSSNFHGLLAWVYENPANDLRIETMADQVAMSPRNFVRMFHRETGLTPAKFVEKARLDVARTLLCDTVQTIAKIADTSGFGNTERMRRTFHRHLKTSPENFRKRFSTGARLPLL